MAGIPPLSYQTPIVDPDNGKPSNFFIRLWQNLFITKNIRITADRSVIKYDGLGVPTPTDQTTTFTAVKSNSAAGVAWTLKDSAGNPLTAASYLSATSGDVVTMTRPQFEAAIAVNSSSGVRVIATVVDDGETFHDVVTVAKLQDGAKGSDGSTGAPGYSIAEISCYQRAASLPSTPTGGSYDFASKVLTPPSGWSVTPPAGTNPLYLAKGTAFVSGLSGTATPSWAGVGKVAQDGSDGQAIDLVYQRSVTQPSTPAASVSVPSGWFGDPASVGAGVGVIWSSVGERATATSNYVWLAPIQLQGSDGLAFDVGTGSWVIACDYIGNPTTGQIPKFSNCTLKTISSDLTSLATFSITGTSGCTATMSGAQVQMTAISAASGYVDVRCSYSTFVATKRITFTKDNTPAPPATTTVTNGLINSTYSATTYSATPQSESVFLKSTASGSIIADISVSYSTTTSGGNHYWRAEGKFGYRLPGAASFVDFSAGPMTGNAAIHIPPIPADGTPAEDDPGDLSGTQTQTGLLANTNYEVAFFYRSTTASGFGTQGSLNGNVFGNMTVRQS